ncbi:putative inositol or phosphatidylinositol kinase [Hibiscus syriacus]|uniref:Inositol or phosphatidylinositol kinase n=1 Tax=Hibiscus syriacus TaxID=106335 RepID=A0A6A2ZPK8_HIBSY|nr:uncharacterized protein LOC120141548 [Hibiscus syriacus]KAE8693486.1 putative inositol or phosphatidylinositol kinase [Hibiscus syriacus]
METPSSARRVTRSQTSAALNNSILVSKGKNEESEKKSVSKTRTRNGKQQQDRSALIDITNDSPIVGLAVGTPTSDISKQWGGKNMRMMTPGSGEALLRGQVKSLLQKVEEEAELLKVPLDNRRPFLHLQSCVNSPMGILAPTPANTPQVEDGGINNTRAMALPVFDEKLRISEVVGSGIFEGLNVESQKSMITRSLLLDFSEKSETSDSTECDSVVTDEGMITGESSASKEKASIDDDNSSVWSMQVNTSTHDEDEETIEEMGDDYYEEEEEEEEEVGDDVGLLVDELCEGLSKMSMKEMFKGKHTRFVYNSDDEIEEECEEDSSEIIRLKGLPTPKGKHWRFPMDDDQDDE